MNDRLLGQRLADALQSQPQASPSHVIAVLSDLLGADVSLLLPLRDLVGRPGFQFLAPSRLGHGSRRAQRDALLQSLGETYNPQVLARLAAFLDGYLESQAPSSVSPAGFIQQESHPQSTTASASSLRPSSTVPMTVIADAHGLAAPVAAVGSSSPAASASMMPKSGTRSTGRRKPLLVASAVAMMALAVGAALRTNLLCAPFGLCSAASITAANAALEQAQEAAVALDKADDLAAYEQSLDDLDRHLGMIDTDALLGRRGQDTRKQLEEKALKGRDRLKKEKSHLLTVRQVKSQLESTDAMPKQAADGRRTALLLRLESVPSGSFAHAQAVALRHELEPRLPQFQPKSTDPLPKPAAAVAPFEPQAPPQVPRYSPSPSSPSPSRSGSGSSVPYRDEPLW